MPLSFTSRSHDMTLSQPPLTPWIEAWADGDEQALSQLVPLVLAELRRLASAHLWRERSGFSLQPTELVNEVYLKLLRQRRVVLHDRTQFFAFASRLMRRVLVDHHRARHTDKRGGGEVPLLLDDALLACEERGVDVERLDDALDSLAKFDSRQARIVELRFFAGLSVRETAAALDLSPATVKREWSVAKAWLRREIRKR